MRTNSFVCTVCRFTDGTPRSLAQPFATKERYGCGIPLAGACPTTMERTLAVGRDHWARRCRNYVVRTSSFVYTVCRLRGRLGHGQALQYLFRFTAGAFDRSRFF